MPVQKRSCLKLKPFTWPRLGRLCWRGKWGFRTGSIVMASRSNPLGRLHLHMPMRRLLWPPRSKVFSPMVLLYSVGIEYVCVVELSHGAFPNHNGSILQPRFVWNDKSLIFNGKAKYFFCPRRSAKFRRVKNLAQMPHNSTHPLPFWTPPPKFFYHWYWFLIPTWSFFVSFLHILFPPVLFFSFHSSKTSKLGQLVPLKTSVAASLPL